MTLPSETIIAQIAVPRPLPGPLSYAVPAELLDRVKVGALVTVPFRNKSIEGYVVGLTTLGLEQATLSNIKIKFVKEAPFAELVFTEKDLKFFQWISDYYQISLGEVFYSSFPRSIFKIPKRPTKEKLSKALPINEVDLVALTTDQDAALTDITNAMKAGTPQSFLLYGVTGSGKTEVYIRAAHLALERGQSALILVPEIALTPQLRRRFEERFGDQVAVLHSSLGEKTRREYWWDILRQRRKIVVGARSAVFAPIKDIGLIVVDEEHEPSYKQEDHLRYHARDLALVRARLFNAVTVLGSATPSIETFQGAIAGKHKLLELRTRPANRPMPTIEVVDLKEAFDNSEPVQKKGTRKLIHKNMLGPQLRQELQRTLNAGEQAMIFVNRKGYSSFLLCTDCGEVPHCLNCSVSMTYYQSTKVLRCHYCGDTSAAPDLCKKCFSRDIKYMGFGTELIENELREFLPHHTIQRLDAETASTVKKLEEILERFRSGKIHILVGTQMLAKGHDFPNVTLIGIVLAEMGLHLPDFRAGERTFQLLAQVAGRAGRGDKSGKVILQTYIPEHYVIQSAVAQDYRAFFAAEIEIRQTFGYPPFSRMAQIECRHHNEQLAHKEAMRIAKLLDELNSTGSGLEYLGPAPASILRIANEFRWQILLKSEKISSLNAFVKTLRKEGVRFIDVDPMSTL